MIKFFSILGVALFVVELIVVILIIKKNSSFNFDNKKSFFDKKMAICFSTIMIFMFLIILEFALVAGIAEDKKIEKFDRIAKEYGAKYSFAGITKAKYVKDNFTFIYNSVLNKDSEVYYLITDSIDMDRNIHYAFISYISNDLTETEFNALLTALINESKETKKEVSASLDKGTVKIKFTYNPVNDDYKCEMYEKIKDTN